MVTRESQADALCRRSYLRFAGGAVACASLAGTPVAAKDESDYDMVVDVVEEGGDNTGQEPINPVLEQVCGDSLNSVLYKFKPGRYAMDRQFRLFDFTEVGFKGDGATIVPTDDFDMSRPRMFRLGTADRPGTDLWFEGIDFDYTASDTGLRAIEAQVRDDLEVRDVHVSGQHDSGTYGPALFDVLDSDGTGIVERFEAPDGGEYSSNTPGDIETGPTGVLVTNYHSGTIRFKDCVVGAFPDNGLYAAGGNGRVLVEGGRYENSNVASIRIGGDESEIRGATVVVDRNRPEDVTQRGIRLDNGDDLVVDDVTVTLEKPDGAAITVLGEVGSARIQNTSVTVGDRVNPGIVVYPDTGPVDVVGTDVEINGGGYAIDVIEQGGAVTCENVNITGSATGEGGRSAIWCGRDGCEFRSLNIDQHGGDDRRAITVFGNDCLLVYGDYRTTNFPIVNHGNDTKIYDLTAEASDGTEALWLKDGEGIEIVRNVLHNGIWNDGAEIEKQYGNEYP